MTTENKTGSGIDTGRRLGVDTGGTFTDFVFFDGRRLQVAKRPSTPDAPEQAVVAGVQALTQAESRPRIVHGSTVATNALLEGKLTRTVYIANKGLGDVLTIGRQARAALYALQPAPKSPPVERTLCLEIDQRSAADGRQVRAIPSAALEQLVGQTAALQPQAVAINLLYSYLDSAAEVRIVSALREALPDTVFISASHAVVPVYREYERGIATWINAALGPVVSGYLDRLTRAIGPLSVMHSAAGTIDVRQASQRAVDLLLSGPAAGLLGARFMGRLAGRERLLSFDMGGTSTDVALIDGDIRLTGEGTIGGYPVAVPMVDMHTIGAGGGSKASVDAGGKLCVGPQSAGAEPGPACYGKGGRLPTVTDANVVLGRLPAATRLAGDLPLDVDAAHRALSGLAQQLDTTTQQAAEGVVKVANETMAAALRVISVQRGENPDDYTLLCFGGAGGLHVCALADALRMQRAMVPIYAGVLSALGMLSAPRSRELSQSLLSDLGTLDTAVVQHHLDGMRRAGRRELVAEGVAADQLRGNVSVDLRYAGQSTTLNLPWRDPDRTASAFHAAHQVRYGHRLPLPVELVNLRLTLQGPEPAVPLAQLEQGTSQPEAQEFVTVHGVASPVPLYVRDQLLAGHSFPGPAIVREQVSTTWVEPGWACTVDIHGNLLLHK